MPAADVEVSADLVRRLLADQHPDLALHLPRALAQEGRELRRYHLHRIDAPSVDALEHLALRGLEPLRVAAHRLHRCATIAPATAGDGLAATLARSLYLGERWEHAFTSGHLTLRADDADALAHLLAQARPLVEP